MTLSLRQWLLVLGLLMGGSASVSGCSAVVHPDVGSLGPAPMACSPGTTMTCACLGKPNGLQSCNANGAYDPCRCSASDTAGAPSLAAAASDGR